MPAPRYKTIQFLLNTIGKTIVVDEESQMDIVTAISGSGPAFFYKIINEIALAGEKLGLDYDKALLLSIQTALGSAQIVESILFVRLIYFFLS